ncbi:MAG: fluoride efflux transporter CrcB [Alphaproteobacteria bacterium]|nr:fluoride efflux transporter CrcB [Alphaproteobacteria bacterium]
MISTIGAVAAGGAIGAVLRHSINILSLKVFGDGFPWGTLIVNVLGSFLIGLLVAWFDNVWQPTQEFRALLITGLLGAFTTFSTFSLDIATLWDKNSLLPATLYITSSVMLSVGALFIAMFIVRNFVS